jgi:hypothetical protein
MITYVDNNLVDISIEYLFNLISRAYLSKKMNKVCEIYLMSEDETQTRLRVQMIDTVNIDRLSPIDKNDVFEIQKYNGTCNLQLKNGDWVSIPGKHFQYTCISTTYNGAPRITLEQAYHLFRTKHATKTH